MQQRRKGIGVEGIFFSLAGSFGCFQSCQGKISKMGWVSNRHFFSDSLGDLESEIKMSAHQCFS